MNSVQPKKILILSFTFMTLLAASLTILSGRPLKSQAKVITSISKNKNTKMPKLTLKLMKKISSSSPEEPQKSDLEKIQSAVRLSTRRIPQGYTTDDTYYYYLSVMASYGSYANDLRLTRIRYSDDGTWASDYMTLKDFGHGTNLDCVTVNGKTWLWTGSDCSSKSGETTTISCFTYKAGKTLRKHGKYYYKIRRAGTRSSYASNVFPAISPDGKKLAVRYTRNGKQYFQIYALKKGKKINTKKILKSFSRSTTKGPFQGFDIKGTTLYTIEGTASTKEMKILHKTYRPIIMRKYNYKSGKSSSKMITGAKKLVHREPEGIQVNSDGRIFLMIASHYKDSYTCPNIYKVRKK